MVYWCMTSAQGGGIPYSFGQQFDALLSVIYFSLRPFTVDSFHSDWMINLNSSYATHWSILRFRWASKHITETRHDQWNRTAHASCLTALVDVTIPSAGKKLSDFGPKYHLCQLWQFFLLSNYSLEKQWITRKNLRRIHSWIFISHSCYLYIV